METLKNKKLSFPAKVFTRVFAALGLILTLAACGNKDGGNNTVAVAPPVYGNGCQNCGVAIPSPVLLATFQMQNPNGNVVFSNMQMYAQSSSIVASASGNAFRNYQGPIAVHGQMTVTQVIKDLSGGCIIQPGTYNLQTSSVGQMGAAGGDVIIPSLITTGGLIDIRIDSPLNTMSGGLLVDNGGLRLYARVSIVRVNGYVCSSDFNDTFN